MVPEELPEALPDALPSVSKLGVLDEALPDVEDLVPPDVDELVPLLPNPREKKNKANRTIKITTIAVIRPLLRAGAAESS